MEKRAYTRLTQKDFTFLFRIKDIPVKLVTEKGQCTAFLVDVSQGGVSLRAKLPDCEDKQLTKMGFFLGNQKVVFKGRIEHVRNQNDWDILGVEFVGFCDDSHEYIAGLHTSLKIRDDGL